MDADLKIKYVEFIEKQLSEMVKKVKKNLSKNQVKRENNIFLFFSDKNAKKYMETGRSFVSQLETRLQKIAFFVSRRKYGVQSVPNIITLCAEDDGNHDGAIGNHLKRNQILIGEEFWKEILEKDMPCDDFINIYKEEYTLAKVEETVIG